MASNDDGCWHLGEGRVMCYNARADTVGNEEHSGDEIINMRIELTIQIQWSIITIVILFMGIYVCAITFYLTDE